ncbi:MAG: hypothetical protein AB1444_12265 [Spirochaetota bacterium]
MDVKTKYPLLSAKNIPAYGVVMGFWIIVSLISAFIMRHVSGGAIGWGVALILGFASVMAGMGIMFGASAVNLKKLRPGFERLAAGEKDPQIPRVWCPVLTMATRAAVELSEKTVKKEANQ